MDGAALTEMTAQQQGVRFKAQNPVLAQLEALGEQIVALKASMIEEDVKAPPAGMVEGSPEEEAGETQEQEDAEGDLLDMTKQDLKDLIAEVVAPLAAAITSLSKGVDVSSKVEGMLKSLGEEVKTMTGATATKTQKDTEATQQEIARLKTQIAELEGGATSLQTGYRASADGRTVTEKAAALHESAQPKPLTPIDETMAWVSKAAAASVNGQVVQ
jgi:hypothetical protein